MTKALGSNSAIRAKLTSGKVGSGRLLGRSPNREWIVSTDSAINATKAEVTATATIRPGNLGGACER